MIKHEKAIETQGDHFDPQKAIHRFLGAADHRFVLVERGIENQWGAYEIAKALDQAVVAHFGMAMDGLEAD